MVTAKVLSFCEEHGHPFTTDRYGFSVCWECEHEARTSCTRCGARGRGEARYSYRIYAGRYCDRCWQEERRSYRDGGENNLPDTDLDEAIDS